MAAQSAGGVAVLTMGQYTIPYRVVRSSRARRVRLRVGPRPVVEIIVPAGYRLGDVRALLEPHLRWILRQLERTSVADAGHHSLHSGASLPFEGADLRLTLVPGRRQYAAIEKIEDRLVVTIHDDDVKRLPDAIEYWYREQARSRIVASAQRWAQTMEITYGRITIRDQRSRWGSCSSLGNLNFSWRLVMAPPPVLEYVVIHELMHRNEPNHGPAFWRGVERYCPRYRERIAWLREHGPRLAAVLQASV